MPTVDIDRMGRGALGAHLKKVKTIVTKHLTLSKNIHHNRTEYHDFRLNENQLRAALMTGDGKAPAKAVLKDGVELLTMKSEMGVTLNVLRQVVGEFERACELVRKPKFARSVRDTVFDTLADIEKMSEKTAVTIEAEEFLKKLVEEYPTAFPGWYRKQRSKAAEDVAEYDQYKDPSSRQSLKFHWWGYEPEDLVEANNTMAQQ